jgi:SPP1 gp7 family putative phage head morphogenesis protein
MDSIEREYKRMLLRYAKKWNDLVEEGMEGLLPGLKDQAKEDLPDIRLDANIDSALRALFESVNGAMMKLFPNSLLRKWAVAMAGMVNDRAKKNVAAVARKVDIEPEPLFNDKDLRGYMENIVDQNVGLIRSIPEEKLSGLKNKLVAAVTADQPQAEIRDMLKSHYRLTKSRASLIARDQTNKLNGALNQYRQKQIGGKRYVWRTSRDERVRPDHKRLDGKTFSWDNPPVVNTSTRARGNPGDDFQCRCTAEIVLQDVID